MNDTNHLLELEVCHVYGSGKQGMIDRLMSLAKEIQNLEDNYFGEDSGSIYLSDGSLLEYSYNDIEENE